MAWFGWIQNKKGEAAEAPEPAPPRLPLERAAEILRHFPVGSRVGYYPEFQRNIRLETLVLGYWINDETAYANHDLTIGGADVVTLRNQAGIHSFPRIDRFHIVIPHASRSELDYGATGLGPAADGMQEKTVNDFRRGNAITLFNRGVEGKIPYLDTSVVRVLDLKDGLYANRRVVLLDPDPASFELLDQRQHQRVSTRIAARCGTVAEELGLACEVLDFSEKGMRVGWGPEGAPEGVKKGARLYLEIPMSHEGRVLTLRGNVLRADAAHMVFTPTALWRDRRFQSLDQLDELEIKTALLHHPGTLAPG